MAYQHEGQYAGHTLVYTGHTKQSDRECLREYIGHTRSTHSVLESDPNPNLGSWTLSKLLNSSPNPIISVSYTHLRAHET